MIFRISSEAIDLPNDKSTHHPFLAAAVFHSFEEHPTIYGLR
jgi:hypothetical protein